MPTRKVKKVKTPQAISAAKQAEALKPRRGRPIKEHKTTKPRKKDYDKPGRPPINSRNKGRMGEREIINLLQPVVNQVYEAHGLEPVRLQRNLLQSDKGGDDVHGLAWLSIEVKRREGGTVDSFWAQCVKQAKAKDAFPVLLYRRNGQAWQAVLYGGLFVVHRNTYRSARVTVGMADFLVWFRMALSCALDAERERVKGEA